MPRLDAGKAGDGRTSLTSSSSIVDSAADPGPRICGPTAFIDDLPQEVLRSKTAACRVAAKLSPRDLLAVADLRRTVNASRTCGSVLVHAHGIRAAWIASLARKTTPFPLVVTLHNVPPPGPLGKLVSNLIAKSATRVVCVSAAIQQAAGIEAVVVPNGVDLQRYKNLDRNAARKKLNIDEAEFVIGCIARLSPEKGVDVLTAAASKVEGATVLIVGDGPEKERIATMAPPNVRLLGYQQSTLPLLAASDAIVAPSRSEGQGIVVLEALASGRAVIASRVGGIPEMIEDGKNGLLVPPDDPEALAAAMKRVVSDDLLRKALAGNASAYAAEHGDIEARTRQIEAVYAAAMVE